VEEGVQARFARGTPSGPLTEAMAVGVCAVSPLPPARTADVLADPEVERRAFGAQTFRVVRTLYDVPGASRRMVVVELLDIGEGPVRFDFRFAFALERWDLADGTVLLRYDPATWSRTEHVTLFRGLCVIEPAGSGSIVTELLIFGSDVSVPFFLRGTLREKTYDTFRTRLARVWEAFARSR
jgi:hypothetical protein